MERSLTNYKLAAVEPGEFLVDDQIERTSSDILRAARVADTFASEQHADEDTLAAERSGERGLFAHSVHTYLTATDRQAARAYLLHDVGSAVFEELTHSGHQETFRYPIDHQTGDAVVGDGARFSDIYALDLLHPTADWRARLSAVELKNNVIGSALTKQGILDSYVFIEASCFAAHAPVKSAEAAGYRPKNQKGYLRAMSVVDNQREIDTLSYSFLQPVEVDHIRSELGLRQLGLEHEADALDAPFLVPRTQYEQMGGLAGLARLVDLEKQRRTGVPTIFGDRVDQPAIPEFYAMTSEISALRKRTAAAVVEQLADSIVQAHVWFRAGNLSEQDLSTFIAEALLQARVDSLKKDLSLAYQQHGAVAAGQIVRIIELEAAGEHEAAAAATKELQANLGTAYICGMSITVDKDGNPVDEDGNPKDCPEIIDGSWGTCPGCKKYVMIIVEQKSKVFCSRKKCALSKSGGKQEASKTKIDNSSAARLTSISNVGARAITGSTVNSDQNIQNGTSVSRTDTKKHPVNADELALAA